MNRRIALAVAPVAIVAAVLASFRMTSAQDPSALPTPDQIVNPQDQPVEMESQWIQPMPRHDQMSGWDLYAGSVYANTSPLWVQAEGLLWWIKGNQLPAMVTTSPNGTPRQDAGVLGASDTSVLFGNERVDDSIRGGFRTTLGVRLGHWFDRFMDSELEFGFLWLGDGQSSGDFYSVSGGDPILARPFFNAQTGLQDSQLVAFPNVVVGDILIETSSDLTSAGALFRQAWWCGDVARVDWLAGYRYMQLQERLLAREFLISTDPAGPAAIGTTFDLFEDFATWNEFHGGELGLQLWTEAFGWTVEVLTKVAIGGVSRTVEISGETLVTPPIGFPSLSQGGLFALPTNIGRFQSCRLSALPEFSVRLRRRITHSFVLTLGYSAMLLDHVVRTGDQIDVTVNPSQIGNGGLSGAARPTVLMNDSTFWVHGFNIGLEW